jgi:hypothetical protein
MHTKQRTFSLSRFGLVGLEIRTRHGPAAMRATELASEAGACES